MKDFRFADPRQHMLRITRNDWTNWLKATYAGHAPDDRLEACKANVDWLLRKIPITPTQRRDLKSLLDLCETNNWQ